MKAKRMSTHLGLLAACVVVSACGSKDYSGRYSGTETVNSGYGSHQNAVVLDLTHSDKTINGNYTAGTTQGSFSAQVNDNDQIINPRMQLTSQQDVSQGAPFTQLPNSTGAVAESGFYEGTVVSDDSGDNERLTLNMRLTTPLNTSYQGSTMNGVVTRYADVQKQQDQAK